MFLLDTVITLPIERWWLYCHRNCVTRKMRAWSPISLKRDIYKISVPWCGTFESITQDIYFRDFLKFWTKNPDRTTMWDIVSTTRDVSSTAFLNINLLLEPHGGCDEREMNEACLGRFSTFAFYCINTLPIQHWWLYCHRKLRHSQNEGVIANFPETRHLQNIGAMMWDIWVHNTGHLFPAISWNFGLKTLTVPQRGTFFPQHATFRRRLF